MQEEIKLEDWDAIIVQGTPRFRFKRKMIAADQVPEELREHLSQQAFAKKAERDAADTVVVEATGDAEGAAHLLEPIEVSSDVRPDTQAVELPEEVKRDNEMFAGVVADLEAQLEAERIRIKGLQDQLERTPAVTIYDAPLKDIVEAMYERFGIYTVFLERYPLPEDVSPITGMMMTNYESGLAYQKQTYFLNNIAVDPKKNDFERLRATALTTRTASVEYNERMANQKPLTPAEERDTNSFDYRTGVGNVQSSATMMRPDGRFGMDEPIAEPNVRGEPTIRKDW